MEDKQIPQNGANLLADFFTFKFMILEILAPVIFGLSLICLLVWSVRAMQHSFGAGLLTLIGGFLAIRIFFELIMVAFSILATLRQIRDRLPEKGSEGASAQQSL